MNEMNKKVNEIMQAHHVEKLDAILALLKDEKAYNNFIVARACFYNAMSLLTPITEAKKIEEELLTEVTTEKYHSGRILNSEDFIGVFSNEDNLYNPQLFLIEKLNRALLGALRIVFPEGFDFLDDFVHVATADVVYPDDIREAKTLEEAESFLYQHIEENLAEKKLTLTYASLLDYSTKMLERKRREQLMREDERMQDFLFKYDNREISALEMIVTTNKNKVKLIKSNKFYFPITKNAMDNYLTLLKCENAEIKVFQNGNVELTFSSEIALNQFLEAYAQRLALENKALKLEDDWHTNMKAVGYLPIY